jgi:hypothetical protein
MVDRDPMEQPGHSRRRFLSTAGLAGTWVACGGGGQGITGGVAGRDGLREDLAYKMAPLDVVSDETLFGQWLGTRRRRFLERWDPRLYRGAFLYDG